MPTSYKEDYDRYSECDLLVKITNYTKFLQDNSLSKKERKVLGKLLAEAVADYQKELRNAK